MFNIAEVLVPKIFTFAKKLLKRIFLTKKQVFVRLCLDNLRKIQLYAILR